MTLTKFFRSNWILAVPLLLVLAAAVACGGEDPTNTPVPPPPTNTPEPTAMMEEPTATPEPTAMMEEPTEAPTAMPKPTEDDSMMMQVPPNQGILPLQAFVNPRLDMPHINGIVTVSHSAPSYNSLTEINPETAELNVVRCDLCADWSVADDGITYTFKLHEGAVWHDGEPITSEDVVLSLELINQPDRLEGYDVLKEYIGGRRHDRNVLFLYYDSSRAVDEYTVEVKTQRPTAAFMQALSWDYFPMYPEHLLKQGVLPTYGDISTIVGSGPFKVIKFDEGVLSEQERNTNYFKEGKPYFDGLQHLVIARERVPGRLPDGSGPDAQLSGQQHKPQRQSGIGKADGGTVNLPLDVGPALPSRMGRDDERGAGTLRRPTSA